MTPAAAEWLPPALRAGPDGEPDVPRLLDALLEGIEAQRRLLEEDIDQVWDDLFIESCADWAVPYIGALLGLPPDAGRLEVAYAIALRRRKGTPAALEDFAEVLTGLTVRVLEGWSITLWAQRLDHPPPPRIASFNVADGSRFRAGTPFERSRRSVTPGGPWSPRAATAVVWPWRVRSYLAAQAAPLPEPGRFSLHPLRTEAPLYLRPRPRRLSSDVGATAGRSRTGDELDAPVRATYRVFEALADEGQISYGTNWEVASGHPLAAGSDTADPTLLALTVDGAHVAWDRLRFGALPPGAAAPAPPGADEVVVDVARGHVEVGSSLGGPVRATWYRPVPGEIGALTGDAEVNPAARVVVEVNPALPISGNRVHTLNAAFSLAEALSAGLDPEDSVLGRPDVEIRLLTSDRLTSPPALSFTPTLPRWRIVAPRPQTPVLVNALNMNLPGANIELEGFHLDGDLRLGPAMEHVRARHLTMNAPAGREVQISTGAWGLGFEARNCILGAIRADLAAEAIAIEDSIVDAAGVRLAVCGGTPGGTPAKEAIAAVGVHAPALRASGVTFAGAVRLETADAVDCLFLDGIEVVQTQEGCLRHCYLGPPLSTPPMLPATYRCVTSPAPTFSSIGFEAAGYYALTLEPVHILQTAASDGGEVGAYHHARRAAAIASLRRRIGEFVPLGLRPGLTLAPEEE
jgi:hypothetical protein